MVVALAASSVQSQVPFAPEATPAPLRTVAMGANPQHAYPTALNRFAAAPNRARVEAPRKNPNVGIEQDVVESATGTPPSVNVYCDSYGGYCEAYASGGSGSGYSFAWDLGYEYYDANGYSATAVNCLSGYGPYFHDVSVTVTDSNGATAMGSGRIYCGDW
jgi:hypothetical protein